MGLFRRKDPLLRQLEKDAAKGDVTAMNHLGLLLSNDDPKRAMKLLVSAANQGHLDAYCGLGTLFMRSGDPQKAAHCYGIAAAEGNPAAMWGLAQAAVRVNDALLLQRALSMLESAAAKDDINAMVALSRLHTNNGFDELSSYLNDPPKAKYYLDMAISRGYEASPVECARVIRDQDPLEALWLYEKAVSQGDKSAVNELNSFAGMLMATDCEGYTWSEDVPYRVSVIYKARLLLGQTDSQIEPKTENITGIREVVATVRANKNLFCGPAPFSVQSAELGAPVSLPVYAAPQLAAN